MNISGKPAFAAPVLPAVLMLLIGGSARADLPLRPGRTHVVTRSAAAAHPVMGPRNAPVTIWIWSSFRNYHMQGLRTKLGGLVTAFPGQVRVVALHRSRGSIDEDQVAQVALEAFSQGNSNLYWKVFDALTGVQQVYRLNVIQAQKLAIAAGVNGALLGKALKTEIHRDTVYNQTMLLLELGGSPTAYDVPILINTTLHRLQRYTYHRYLANIIQQELAKARAAMKSGIPLSRIPRWALEKAKRQARFRTYPYHRHRYRYGAYPTAPSMRNLGVGTTAPLRRYHVPVDGAPVRGNPLAVVTAVLFIDFRNYYSQRAWQEILKLSGELKNRMRLAVRMLPAATDRHSGWAARLAIAAHRLGKFWDVAAEMNKNRHRLYPTYLKQFAEKAGVDPAALKTQMESKEVRQGLNRDRRLATRLGVFRGPVIFINGRKIASITSTYARFFIDAVVRDELKPGLLGRFLGDNGMRPLLP